MTVFGILIHREAVQQRVEIQQISPGLYCRSRVCG